MKKTRSTNSFSGSVDSSTDRKEQAPGSDPRLLVNILGGQSLDQMNLESFVQILRKRQSKKMRSQNAIGATRIKLAEIVSKCLGVECTPNNLYPAKGAWRTDVRLDVYRWEVVATKGNIPFVAGCWDTMTDCVKAGAVHCVDGVIYLGRE